MCGIIGYVGERRAEQVLIDGLSRLEYRGYDSAGICVSDGETLRSLRAVGNLAQLKSKLNGGLTNGASALGAGIGHTRWATHGRVTIDNAHPLAACHDGELAIVLNGIVENFQALREKLEDDEHVFRSQTDAEAVAHLVERHYDGDLVAAVEATTRDLEGHFAFAVVHRAHHGLIVGARRHCPLVVGIAEDELFLASTIGAFLAETRKVAVVEDGDVVAVEREGARFYAAGRRVARRAAHVDWKDEVAEKGGQRTFMLKEINEQPEALVETLRGRLQPHALSTELGLSDDLLRDVRRILVLACGTAYHAGVVARYAIEDWARVPCDVDIASEWRYRQPIVDEGTLVIGISQSGETADTLGALRLARSFGAVTLAVTNMPGTQITREVDSVLFTRAGLEMGVAATKTFTAQVAVLFAFALELARARGTLADAELELLRGELESVPAKVAQFLGDDHAVAEIAEREYLSPFFLYLGRHIGLPVCLEGALKLKEIAYIPTEAYSAGEMKHGPIALLDDKTPVVCIATDSHVYEKVVSNIQEVRARGARVIAIATDGNESIQHLADEVVYVPRTHPHLQALLAVVPLQLLAHDIAELRGLNVDQPRNLAKTVTVE